MSADTVPNTTGYTTYPSSSAPSVTPNPDPNTNPSTLSEQSGATAPDSNLNPRSCVTCRRRKVRCNKREPCSNCVKAGIDCIFPGPGRAPRKQRRPPDVEVLSRLRRLEGVVESLGGTDAIEKLLTAKLGSDSEANNAASPAQASAVENANLPKESDASGQAIWNIASARNNGAYEELGRLVIDESKSAYVSDRFWSSVGNQIEELEGLLDSDSEQEGENTTSPEDSTQSPNNNNHDMFLFGYNSLAKSVSNYHPTPTQVFILWKTYEQNVAPLLTMVHKPTIRNLIINVATNQDPVDKNNEALLFAVYFAAVISMHPEQCLAELGDDRDSAISRFRFATEQALARANLVNSRSINLLQAAVLFISSVHKVDKGRFVWTMTALLLRLATGLGLHRDGTNFGLSPFETEMRRRLWWHIIIVDARTAEDHGTEPMINESMYDTRFPLHINDDDISPESKTFPSGRAAFTDMTFTLIRCHVSQNYRHLTHFSLGRHSIGPTLEECKKTVENLHNTLNENFIQHCDMQEPFQWACATMARLVVAKLWLVVHHPLIKTNLTSLAPEERNKILLTSIEVIEFTRLMETSDATRRWSWLFGSYVQWHAIAFVLAELCVRPRCPGVDRAWLAIDSTFHEWERMSIGKKGPLWRPLKKLYDKAQTFRAARFGPPELSFSAMNLPFNGLNGNIPTIQQQQQQQQQVLLPQKPQSEEQQRNGSTSSSGPYQLDGKSSQLSSPGQTSHDTRPNLSRSAILSQTPARNRTETVNKTIPEFNLDLSKSIPDIMSDFMPTYTMAISDSSGDNILNASDVPNTTTGRNNETTSAFPPPAPPPPPPNAFINNFNPVDNIWPQVTPNTFGMPINWDQLDDVMRDFQQEFEQAAGPDSGEAQIRFM